METNQSLGQIISDFSLKLYQKLSTQQNNLVFSPSSIYLALAMTAIGSKESTLEQFKQLLNFNVPLQLAQEIQSLKQILVKQNNGVTTQIANKIYVDLPQLGKEYEQLMITSFESAIEEVKFSDCELVRKNINEWVLQQTNQKIKELLAKGAINNQTKMVLVNAIYFKGEWLKKFQEIKTHKRDFYLEQDQNGQPIQVDTMCNDDKFDFFECQQYKYVSIPYKGNEYVMEIILPTESFSKFESTLNPQTFLYSRQNNTNTKIKLFLPKFKIEAQNSTSLKQILKQLGIEKAFTNDANFSFMDPENSITISDVIHKAMIEVNEEGAEAAAATAVIMKLKCKSKSPPIPIMDCNKPFIYSITHKPSNTIMFLGKITNPLQN